MRELIRRGRIFCPAFLCLAVLAAACGEKNADGPRANAEGVPVAEATPVAGPVLYGEGVAWGEGGIEAEVASESIRVLVASPGQLRRLLYEQRASRGQPEWWFGDFDASAREVAFARAWSDCEPPPYDQCGVESDIAVVGRDDKVRLLRRHDTDCGFSPGAPHVDVDRRRLAFGSPYCVPECAPPYCRPQCGPCWRMAVAGIPDREPARTLSQTAGRDGVRIMGNFIAAWTRAKLAVYDARSTRLVYSVRLPEEFPWIDLQGDGKTVVVWSGRDEIRAAWFSPDEPWRHSLPIRPVLSHSYEEHSLHTVVRLAGDHVAFERQITPETSELVVAPLDDGEPVQHVATFDQKRARVGDFDFDGKRVTWAMKKVERVTKNCWRISEAGHMACQKHYSGPTTIYLAQLG